MLKHHDSSAIVALSDFARARAPAFYSDVLGLELDADGSGESGGGEEGVLQPLRRGW